MRTYPHHRRESGAILILFAASVGVVATLGAVVVGLSNGYAAVRSTQNAADAASIAATHRLHEILNEFLEPVDADGGSVVLETARSVAADNGADPDTVICEIVEPGYAISRSDADVIGPCDGVNEDDPLAAGVRVTVSETREVLFGQFVGATETAATNSATATMQPVREGASPFMVCANAPGHPIPLLESLNSPWAINDAAIGADVVLWGNQMKEQGRDCGSGSSSWRGLVAFEGSWPLPSPEGDTSQWWEVKTGNSGGHIPRLLGGQNVCGTGAANEDALGLVDCRIAVPLCTRSDLGTGSGLKLHCARMGAFEITYNSKGGSSSGPAPCVTSGNTNNLICGRFLGAAIATEGDTAASDPYFGEIVAIRLVE